MDERKTESIDIAEDLVDQIRGFLREAETVEQWIETRIKSSLTNYQRRTGKNPEEIIHINLPPMTIQKFAQIVLDISPEIARSSRAGRVDGESLSMPSAKRIIVAWLRQAIRASMLGARK